MYWWQHAAALVNAGGVQRFSFITTNSLKQTFNRRVVQQALADGLHLAFAIPDHPWVDSVDGAAVRIAMTVGTALKNGDGRLLTVTAEREAGGEGLEVTLDNCSGKLHADLRIGADVAGAVALRANVGIGNRGVQMLATGFVLTEDEAQALAADDLIKPYRNGKDLTDRPRGALALDTFGFEEAQLRASYPAAWQWLFNRAKPERDQNPRASYRENWWLFGESQPAMRATISGLKRYIATPITAKHRIFQFLESNVVPDQALVCIALDDAFPLGVLSSAVHVVWVLAAGGTLEDRPSYNKTRCFETFPFPDATPDQQARIRALAEQLDAHRKRQQVQHPTLTLTGLYNVLAKLRAGEALTAKDKTLHEQGLVSVLQTLHDELDAAVLAAYGWSDLPATANEALLERLVALNAERAREEAAGHIRWLRPEGSALGVRPAFQNPQASLAAVDPEKQPKTTSTAPGTKYPWGATAETPTPATSDAPKEVPLGEKSPWPATLPEQMALLARLLATAPAPLAEAAIAARITGKGP
jgi:hypothetical protein